MDSLSKTIGGEVQYISTGIVGWVDMAVTPCGRSFLFTQSLPCHQLRVRMGEERLEA